MTPDDYPAGSRDGDSDAPAPGDGHADEDAPDPELVAALRRARRRRPWTVVAVREYAADPQRSKADADVCDACERPCRREEVCATLVAREAGVLDEVGRTQAFHLVESGLERLRARNEARVRETDDQRPNTFIELTEEES